ncbi:MAG TPA: phospholipid carrier-dependent glycosyltransferase [Actinomycetales bacterium]|nr:phospholipid carrier-dependent glycosyltransferase [Actinomycetales bacterium]
MTTATAVRDPAPVPAAARESVLRRHLVGRTPHDQLWGWVAPLIVAAVAGVLRFFRLGEPHQLVFDETYYVKQAYTYLQVGYELRWPEGADESFTAGTPDVYSDTADFPVHPPVGKWMIALGIRLFGVESSFGWRFSAALVGMLMVLLVARIARRLLGSTLLGATAGLLLAVDGHHLVHSRTSLLDIFLAFWALAAFGALLVDRDRSRARLARVVAARRQAGQGVSAWGPWLGLRPWRLLGAVCLGLAVGTKWSGLFFVAAFGLMTVLWDVGARRAAGLGTSRLGGIVTQGVPAALVVLPVVGVTYLSSWAGWFASSDAHLRRYARENLPDSLVPDALRSLGKYHQDMYSFHRGLESDHPYEAHPWSWLVQGRPTSFFYESFERGDAGCAVASCSKAITSLGNPVVWWGGTVAVVVVLFCWLLRRDWRAGAILAGLAGGYLPWFAYSERTIYAFYSVAFVPFVVLALAYALGLLLGPRKAPPSRRMIGALLAGAVVVAAVVALAWFWPVWTAEVIPYGQWRARMWLPSWI